MKTSVRHNRLVQRLSFLVSLVSSLALSSPASAQVELTWARIEYLRNRVQLIPSNSTARPARVSDLLGIGDALRTAASSRAELQFNDGSIARIGERATFRFTPNTRNFQLSNGTVLLLVPPGRGRSTIQTPNAVTGIQGSALFVRFIPETNTTIIGALTDNPGGPMVAYNQDGSQQRALSSGEIVAIEGNNISPPLVFDLRTFYTTSGLVEGLNLNTPEISTGSADIDAVRQEITEAIQQQVPVSENDAIENPTFLVPPPAESQTDSQAQDDAFTDSDAAFKDSPAAEYLEESTDDTSPPESATPDGSEGDANADEEGDPEESQLESNGSDEEGAQAGEGIDDGLDQDPSDGAQNDPETVENSPSDAANSGDVDAGPENAGPEDAGSENAGPENAGPENAGPEDASSGGGPNGDPSNELDNSLTEDLDTDPGVNIDPEVNPNAGEEPISGESVDGPLSPPRNPENGSTPVPGDTVPGTPEGLPDASSPESGNPIPAQNTPAPGASPQPTPSMEQNLPLESTGTASPGGSPGTPPSQEIAPTQALPSDAVPTPGELPTQNIPSAIPQAGPSSVAPASVTPEQNMSPAVLPSQTIATPDSPLPGQDAIPPGQDTMPVEQEVLMMDPDDRMDPDNQMDPETETPEAEANGPVPNVSVQ
ncbi:MAG: FecR domain-containing protein [Cyanobacteria bacterium P01_A01_bin.114]